MSEVWGTVFVMRTRSRSRIDVTRGAAATLAGPVTVARRVHKLVVALDVTTDRRSRGERRSFQEVEMAAGEDGLVRFELDAPDARDVFVAGTFNDWRPDVTPLTRREGGPWTADLELAPGRYEYKFIVDGAWCCDVGLDGPRGWIDGAIPNAMGTSNRVIDVDE